MDTETVWIADAAPAPAAPAGPAAPAVNPGTLALRAERSMRLPSPVLHFDPTPATVVNLPTWLWVDPALWTPVSVSASAGSVTATAVATPESVVWAMGDGATVPCDGPGAPFRPAVPASDQSTTCSYAYPVSSIGQPSPDGDPDHAAFTVIATVTWSVRWSSQGVAGGGVLPDLTTSGSASLRVEQVESVNADADLTALTVAVRPSVLLPHFGPSQLLRAPQLIRAPQPSRFSEGPGAPQASRSPQGPQPIRAQEAAR